MKQLLLVPALVLAAGLATAGDAHAAVVTLPAAGISIDAPDSWSVSTADTGLSLSAPEGTTGVSLALDPATAPEGAWEHLVTFLGGQLADLEVGEIERGRINALPVQIAYARGTGNDEALGLVLAVVTTPTGGQLTMIGMHTVGADEARGLEMDQAMNSIAAIEAEVPAAADEPAAPAVPAEAAAMMQKLTRAIDENNVKAFLSLLPSKLELGGRMVSKAKVKKALKKRAKKGGIAAYLGLERGEWQVIQFVEGSYVLYRDDGGAKHTYLLVTQVGGKWRVTGTGTIEALG